MIFRFYSTITDLLKKDRSEWIGTVVTSEVLRKKNTLWFHAASAGELEILIPLIEATVKEGRPACVSIFSPSAEKWLKKLPSELLYRGFSPRESAWGDAFQHFAVSEVVTSKYEAWPGLWRAASQLGIRITVVCAQFRSSFVWAKRAMKWMGGDLPKLRFYTLEEKETLKLQEWFPNAECITSADPRWLRVVKRAENAHAHAAFQKWRALYAHAPKPYWVIGSAWPQDMEVLSDSIKNYPGTVWVVPHSLKESPSPAIFAPHQNCVLVDEMGLLVELYSIADRAWVGGGFGEGIHSTLEPVVYSIPVACGPNKVENFFEAREFLENGVLTVCKNSTEIQRWLNSPSQKTGFSLKLKMEKIQEMIGHMVQGIGNKT